MFKRTHTCGGLNASNIGDTIFLNGWISKSRDLGGLHFIDLRDRYGKTQIVFNENINKEAFDRVKKLGLEDGIQATRSILNRCWFDKQKCERGIEALKQYRRTFDDKNKAFKNRPLHDWTSHAADSFRYMAIGLKPRRKYKELEFNTAWIA